MASTTATRKSRSDYSLARKLLLANIGLYDRMFEQTRTVATDAAQRASNLFSGLVKDGEQIEDTIIHRLEENETFSFSEAYVRVMSRRIGKARDQVIDQIEDAVDEVVEDVRERVEGAGLTRRAISRTAKRVLHDITGDDLTLIKGIGPKRAGELHAEGIRTFEQLALMTKAELKMLDDKLNLGGRALRSDWRGQAKQFAKAA